MTHLELFEKAFPQLRISRALVNRLETDSAERIVEGLGKEARTWLWELKRLNAKTGFPRLPDLRREDAVMFNRLYMLVHYIAAGEQCFSLSQSLAEEFVKTPVKKMAVQDIVLPHRAFYIEFPDLWYTGVDERHVPVIGCYVVDCNPDFNGLAFMVATPPNGVAENFAGFHGPFKQCLEEETVEWSEFRAGHKEHFGGKSRLVNSDGSLKERCPHGIFAEERIRVVVNTLRYISQEDRVLREAMSTRDIIQSLTDLIWLPRCLRSKLLNYSRTASRTRRTFVEEES